MNTLKKYNNIFMEALLIDEDQLKGLKYQDVSEWDSVGHMSLIAMIEEEFDLELETDDIIDLSSYEIGMEILAKYNVDFGR